MKQPIIAILLVAMLYASTSWSIESPTEVKKVIAVFARDAPTLEAGVLRSRINRSVVSFDIFANLLKGLCYRIYLADKGKDGWGGARIERIEVVNDIGAQGFAIEKPRKVCADIGKMNIDDERGYLRTFSWVCIASSPCRPRRDGEKTSGDE